MKINRPNSNFKWVLFICTFSIIIYFLYEINKLVVQLRYEEKKKIELWANAISRKSELVQHTEIFFKQVREEERKKVEQFIEAHKIILEQPLDQEIDFYFRFVADNKTIPVIITDQDNNISLSQNISLPPNYTVLQGDLLKEFSKNQPLKYNVYGMKFKLFYTDSKVNTDMHNMLLDISKSLLSEVTENYVFVPAIITDRKRSTIYAWGNVTPERLTQNNLQQTLSTMESYNKPIEITLPDKREALVFYEDSKTLKILKLYPIIFFLIFTTLSLIAYQFLRTIKKSEQNSLWAALSKETAHQLGTPISSLIAWVEYLSTNPQNITYAQEIKKDIHRLETITERFSKIGANPELTKQDLIPIIQNTITYLQARSPKKIEFQIILPQDKTIVLLLNTALMEWVIENLSKNAIDAMQAAGKLTIQITTDDKNVHIDFTDTGKGIPKKLQKKIFLTGYSTKTRGWGLGLSLSRRIIKEYHKGKIYLLQSTPAEGTTFRISLPKIKT